MTFQYVYYFLTGLCKISILPLFVFLFTVPAHAEWTVLDSGTTSNLRAIDFPVNEDTGYAVGSKGTIVKTTDAGSSWKKQKSHTREHLLDVDFVDNLVGFATGINGTILKTTNGGTSWSQLNSDTTQHLYTVQFPVNANIGYVGGSSGTLLKTTDGGQTWIPQLGVEGTVKDIVFPQNATTGFVSTIWGTLGYIYKTIDGGLNWTRVLFLEDAFLESMSFPLDDQIGYVANNDTYYQHGVWKTTDGGANWNFVTQGITSVPVAIDFPVDTQTGLAVGYSGAVMKTIDGGASWTEGNIGVNSSLEDIDMVNNSIGYAVGGTGLILKTTDGGTAPIEILYLHPTASGSINAFTDLVGCSTDWDCVNDQSGNLGSGTPATVNSRDYIADGSGNRAMFALDDGAISANQSVSEICVSFAATQWYGSYANPSYQRVGIDPAPVDTTPFWVSYWYDGMASHCWGNLNWSASDLDALEIGVITVDGKWLEVGQLYVKVLYTTAP
jgi:photosystem II stability/assembly factor-like uncharacterized protein